MTGSVRNIHAFDFFFYPLHLLKRFPQHLLVEGERGDAHQADNPDFLAILKLLDECLDFIGGNPLFIRFLANIYLDKTIERGLQSFSNSMAVASRSRE